MLPSDSAAPGFADDDRVPEAPPYPRQTPTIGPQRILAYAATLLIVAACTLVAAFMDRHFDPPNLTMIYLLGVVIAAISFGRGPAVAAAVLSVAVFNFAFVPPRFTFRVADTQYLVTFGVMLVVGVVIGTLTAWLREQNEAARLRERRTAALHRLSRDLALRSTTEEVVASAARRIAEIMDARVAISLGDAAGDLAVVAGDASVLGDREERDAARRAHQMGTWIPFQQESPGVLHLPLEAGTNRRGVLSILRAEPGSREGREPFHLLRALASQTALAVERCRLTEDMERVRLQAETERTRSALLSSVSHDLRTPLASITGAASSLRDDSSALSEATRRELADTIAEEVQRLNRLIGNLLDMTRLESGPLRLKREWHSLEELVGAALARLEPISSDRPVRSHLPADLPLVRLDEVLFEQVVRNLVENALKYSPSGEPIDVRARLDGGCLHFEVADRGSGIPPGEERRVFEKFYRGSNVTGQPGVGLGLAICQAIVQAHGGAIEASNRAGGGARFTVRLPVESAPPPIAAEPDDAESARTER